MARFSAFRDPEVAAAAGRKSRRGLGFRNQILNDLFNPEKAKKVFLELERQALAGEIEAIKVYMAYCFGKPKEVIDINAVIETKRAPSWFVSQDHTMIIEEAQSES